MTNILDKSPPMEISNPESVGPRDWGSEELLIVSPGKYSLKRLILKAGSKGGLQYHREKDEAGYLVRGELIIRFMDENKRLRERVFYAGDSFRFPAMCIHQEEAITDCEIIEVSTPHFNDRVRVEQLFGLQEEGGLPTTNHSDIETR
jgi:mannose-6-phosphate isomerase